MLYMVTFTINISPMLAYIPAPWILWDIYIYIYMHRMQTMDISQTPLKNGNTCLWKYHILQYLLQDHYIQTLYAHPSYNLCVLAIQASCVYNSRWTDSRPSSNMGHLPKFWLWQMGYDEIWWQDGCSKCEGRFFGSVGVRSLVFFKVGFWKRAAGGGWRSQFLGSPVVSCMPRVHEIHEHRLAWDVTMGRKSTSPRRFNQFNIMQQAINVSEHDDQV